MENWTLADPLWLLGLLLVPWVVWLRRRRGVPALVVPFSAAWYRNQWIPSSRVPAMLALAGLALVTIALARPQQIQDRRQVRQQGYDLILAIDLSGSMLAEDYERGGERLNRLQAVKPVIEAFINERVNDRIGIVIFSGRAYTLAPLTFDHPWLRRQVERLRVGLIEDGTAIGDGLGVALTRLEQKEKLSGDLRNGAFVILLTDGANNRGSLAPLDAARIAESRGIPVYTIGAGREGYVPMPVFNEQGKRLGYRRVLSDLDEETLRQIASRTGAAYFRAGDSDTISSAFAAIDRAQKIEFQAQAHLKVRELFGWFAAGGTACFALAALLVRPPWRKASLT